jgi:hypothetical protein
MAMTFALSFTHRDVDIDRARHRELGGIDRQSAQLRRLVASNRRIVAGRENNHDETVAASHHLYVGSVLQKTGSDGGQVNIPDRKIHRKITVGIGLHDDVSARWSIDGRVGDGIALTVAHRAPNRAGRFRRPASHDDTTSAAATRKPTELYE